MDVVLAALAGVSLNPSCALEKQWKQMFDERSLNIKIIERAVIKFLSFLTLASLLWIFNYQRPRISLS
jgi:predicted small integral membrane protein